MASDTDRDLGGPEVIEPALAPAALRTRRGDVDLDGLARLEGERRFLLRSLNDLEREYEAGDVDEADYVALKDGYTARAAVTLRAIQRGRATLPGARRTSAVRVALWVVGILVVASLAGWGLARSSGTRLPGETITGGLPADEVALALTEARALLSTSDFGGAFDRFQRVIELEPGNAEARTYTAWVLVLNTRFTDDPAVIDTSIDAALATFQRVVDDEPGYADAHCLYAVTAGNFLPEPDVELAREQGALCLESNPPADMVGLVQGFLAGLDDPAVTVP